MSVVRMLANGYKLDNINTVCGESVLMIPTPVGIPLYFNASYTHVVHLFGDVKTEGDLMTLITNPQPIAVAVDIKPKWVQIFISVINNS